MQQHNNTTTQQHNNATTQNNTEEIYARRSNIVERNFLAIQEVFKKHDTVVKPALDICPNLPLILAHMLVLHLGWQVKDIDFTSSMSEWNDDDCRYVGRSMATFMRTFQQGNTALDAWRRQYPQLNNLFDLEGIDAFMLVIANNLLRDNKYGMVFRVATGAVLSIIDGVSDLYILSTYYSNESLTGQGNMLLAMILSSIFVQIILVFAQYQRKGWGVKLREIFIVLLFLRPAVDAYRVSTNHKDSEATLTPLSEMMCNKV